MNRHQIDRETLYELYITKDMTQEEIATLLGVSARTVGRRLKELGIVKEYPRPFEDREWLYNERYLQHRTVEDIAKECRVGKKTIEYYIKLYEIPKPPLYKDLEIDILCHRCKNPITKKLKNVIDTIKLEGRYKFYCKPCFKEIKRESFTKEKNPLYKGELPVVECLHCGKKYKVDHFRFEEMQIGKRRPLCSPICKSLYNEKTHDTVIEIAIENELKRRNISYVKQYPIKVFIADFYLPDYNLIIECDGDYWHTLDHQIKKDKRKNKYYRTLGYSVYRYWEHEIKEDVSACVDDILDNIEKGVKLRIKNVDGTIQKTTE